MGFCEKRHRGFFFDFDVQPILMLLMLAEDFYWDLSYKRSFEPILCMAEMA